MHRVNWDDLRFVLAVAEAGSVSAAARGLKVNHATVLRRVAAFEESFGITVFDRTPQGYDVIPDRKRLIDALQEVGNSVLAVERIVAGATAPLRGTVRVTSTDTFCQSVLPAIVAQIGARQRELKIDLLSSNAHLDLGRLDADITVRPAEALPEGLFGERAAMLAFDVYAAPGRRDGWLGLSGPLARTIPGRWLSENHGKSRFNGAADSFVTLREMAAEGAGRAILPCILGDRDGRLQRLRGILPPSRVAIWVASHTDLADVPRIRVVRRRLAEALAAREKELLGEV